MANTEEEGTHDVLGMGWSREHSSSLGPRKRVRLEAPSSTQTARFLHGDWAFIDCATRTLGERAATTPLAGRDAEELGREDSQGYDCITALSVAKWIHIDNYDDGLRRFFARVAACLRSDGGVFIIEVQPYKSYKQTLKVTPPTSQARRNYYALRVLPDDFPWILTVELGLFGPYSIKEAGQEGKKNG